ncbi:MAG: glycosyltransferase family 4 protein [Caldilineaceae bacterium]|nr:glycosyltransferase family 4 protein [Caldilineaceae bacterium]
MKLAAERRAGVHVAINAHLLSSAASYRSAGVSNYSRHLLAALGQLVVDGAIPHRFTAFLHAGDFAPPGVELRQGSPYLERPLVRIAWEQGILPIELKHIQADVMHGLVNVLPLATHRPGVVTVHDLSFLRLPELFPPYKRAYLTALCRASVARARQIVAVSRQTADDLSLAWGVDEGRVLVAPNGVAARFSPGTPVQSAAFRQAQALPERYWLYLGTLEPRKNLSLLLSAFARWRQQASPADQGVHLVLAGGKGWYYETIFAQVEALGLAEVVHFPGYVPDDLLPAWYQAAELFLYPSRYEGFGLPVVEAMACGTPVICSDAPGVREVAGDAAILVAPDDVDAWVAALAMAATQPALRAELGHAGVARARQFTWETAAAVTIEAYERAAYRPN